MKKKGVNGWSLWLHYIEISIKIFK